MKIIFSQVTKTDSDKLISEYYCKLIHHIL